MKVLESIESFVMKLKEQGIDSPRIELTVKSSEFLGIMGSIEHLSRYSTPNASGEINSFHFWANNSMVIVRR